MTTPFYSPSCTPGSGIQPRAGLALCSVSGTYDIAATLLTADVIHLVKIPKGATVIDLILDCGDMDAASALTLSVGYTGALEAFISQSTIGRAGGIARLSVVGGTQKKFDADDTIQVSATAGAGGADTSGTMKLTVFYTMDP
jgi:hypothetical protein